MKHTSLEDLTNYIFFNSISTLKETIPKEQRLELFAAYLKQIGSPEQGLNIIHVAGTSGKGSTTTILANLLKSQGFKVGHIVSPHINDINERFQLDCKPIETNKLLAYANVVFSTENHLTPFEKITALQFYIFSCEKPDYIILETGIGGRLDPTNVPVKHKTCVLNSIGMDHTEYLGTTLEEIAQEKSGIIQQKNQVIALSQSKEINKIFIDTTSTKNAKINFINYEQDIQNIVQNAILISFDYTDLHQRNHSFALSLMGKYQAGNCSLALRAMEHVALKDSWTINWKNVEISLEKIAFPGRFEITKTSKNKISIIDGAHNPQKMEAFLASIVLAFPNKKFNLVLAMKNGKDSDSVLRVVTKYSSHISSIILTTFSGIEGLGLTSISTEAMMSNLVKCGFDKTIVKVDSLNRVFEMIDTTKNNYIFTGSLYIIGTIRSKLGLV
jgi:dihydrofolate synthase / folylpolyglutamate synthase